MVLVGLLLIALFCLAIGLVLASSAWLVASLIASAGAGVLLYRTNQAMKQRAAAKAASAGSGSDVASAAGTADQAESSATTAGPARAAKLPKAAKALKPAKPAKPSRAERRAAAATVAPTVVTPVAAATTSTDPTTTQSEPAGVAASAATAPAVEPRPAVVADSSVQSVGEHLPPATPLLDETADAAGAAPTVDAPPEPDPAAEPDDVWVIDGRPRYHLHHCAIIKGQDAEPIPFQQAVEDGFMPCSLCEPNSARATG